MLAKENMNLNFNRGFFPNLMNIINFKQKFK